MSHDFSAQALEDIIFRDWRSWGELTDAHGAPWTATQMAVQLARAHRRAAAYELLVLSHMSPMLAWRARYALLARTATHVNDGPMWLRSVSSSLTWSAQLVPYMSDADRKAFEALHESIVEDHHSALERHGDVLDTGRDG